MSYVNTTRESNRCVMDGDYMDDDTSFCSDFKITEDGISFILSGKKPGQTDAFQTINYTTLLDPRQALDLGQWLCLAARRLGNECSHCHGTGKTPIDERG